MIKRLSSLGLILFGAVVSIISLVADHIGFGSGPDQVGWKQLTGAVVGIFLAIFGLWLSQVQAQANSGKDQKK